MATSLFATATEYVANAITLTRGKVTDIKSVGIYANTNPNQIPTPAQFTTVLLVDGTGIPPLPPLAGRSTRSPRSARAVPSPAPPSRPGT